VKSFLDGFPIPYRRAGNFDEFGYNVAHSAFGPESILWKNKIVLARTGLALPDIMFTTKNNEDVRCMVSIQVHTKNERLAAMKVGQINADAIDQVVLNVSRTHFFRNSAQAPSFVDIWKKTLMQYQVYHVRVIISWVGFTDQQMEMVNFFNTQNLQQPIVLIAPSKDNCAQLYGGDAYQAILASMGKTKHTWETKVKQTVTTELVVKEEFTKRVRMELSEQEKLELPPTEELELAKNVEGLNL
jgi:hypothetical protein